MSLGLRFFVVVVVSKPYVAFSAFQHFHIHCMPQRLLYAYTYSLILGEHDLRTWTNARAFCSSISVAGKFVSAKTILCFSSPLPSQFVRSCNTSVGIHFICVVGVWLAWLEDEESTLTSGSSAADWEKTLEVRNSCLSWRYFLLVTASFCCQLSRRSLKDFASPALWLRHLKLLQRWCSNPDMCIHAQPLAMRPIWRLSTHSNICVSAAMSLFSQC